MLFLVRWTQSVQYMLADGMTEFVECGLVQVLTGLVGRMKG
jgi:malonyl CoA-acyl carrier protein transacylase